MKENMKKFRIGQRSAKSTGVISVVTNVTYPEDVDNTSGMYIVEYGASFCSPTEPQYIKKFGYELAEERLCTPGSLYTGEFMVKYLLHDDVMMKVLFSLALDPHIPCWSTRFIYAIINDGIIWYEGPN